MIDLERVLQVIDDTLAQHRAIVGMAQLTLANDEARLVLALAIEDQVIEALKTLRGRIVQECS